MTIVRFNPWHDIHTLNRQIDRFFEDDFATSVWKELNQFSTVPAVELTETEDAVQLKLEIPGIDAKDLDVEVTETVVSIKGERKSTTESNAGSETASGIGPESAGKTRSEFHYGSFRRVVPLPARIKNTDVAADYKDGILHLTLPKTEAEKNKVVKINLDQSAA